MLTIRTMDGMADMEACAALQRHTWGDAFDDVLAPALLVVLPRIGGIILGAFAADRLVGMAVSLPGVVDGQRIQWSDRAAVHADYRDAGVGRALKQRQREESLARGCARILWTYDPLESRNAWLNLERLGARVQRYEIDFYGQIAGGRLGGMDTDRFVVAWDLQAEPTRCEAPQPEPEAVVLAADGDLPGRLRLDGEADPQWVEIPWDVQALKARDLEAANAWRMATRAVFTSYMARGWRVDGLQRVDGRAFYRLRR